MSSSTDLADIFRVHRQAFGGTIEADLVAALLDDPTAQPLLSLVAVEDDQVQGHVLFTSVRLTAPPGAEGAAILAPLAVVPAAQGKGLGGKLIEAGLDHLRQAGVALVFVLGDPAYYRRFGFQPAGRQGLLAPYPLAREQAGAWMVQALRPGLLGRTKGTVTCCDTLMQPALWKE